MRAVRWILVTLAILAGVYVAADFALRAYAESQVAAAVQTELRLSHQPDLTLGGFPFLPRAASGHLDQVTADASDVTIEGGLSFRRVDVTLHDVSFSASSLILGRTTAIRAQRGDGTARMTGDDITRAIQEAGTDVRVRLAGGHVHVSGGGLPGERTAEVSVEGTTLELRPAGLPVRVVVRVDLGELAPGVRYTKVRIVGSEAVVSLSLRRLTFQI